MEILTQFVIFITKIYTRLYGDVFEGYFYQDKFYRPILFEQYFYIFPSFFNHFYGRFISNQYLYKKNNMLYLSNIKESKQLTPPILSFMIDGVEYKNMITKFSNNIPFDYIWRYYDLTQNLPIVFRYLKGGIKTRESTLDEIRNDSLINLI